MIIKLIVALFSVTILLGCGEHTLESRLTKLNPSDTLLRLVPVGLNEQQDPSVQYVRFASNFLNLSKIDSGANGFTCRIWYSDAGYDTTNLLIIQKKENSWSCQSYLFYYKLKEETQQESIILLQTKSLEKPNSGWSSFINRLSKFQLESLPNMAELTTGKVDIADGNPVIIELAV